MTVVPFKGIKVVDLEPVVIEGTQSCSFHLVWRHKIPQEKWNKKQSMSFLHAKSTQKDKKTLRSLTFQLFVEQGETCELEVNARFYRRIGWREEREDKVIAVSTSKLHTSTYDATVAAVLDQDTMPQDISRISDDEWIVGNMTWWKWKERKKTDEMYVLCK